MARALESWRFAERLRDESEPDTGEYRLLDHAVEDLRRTYQELSDERNVTGEYMLAADASITRAEQLIADIRDKRPDVTD